MVVPYIVVSLSRSVPVFCHFPSTTFSEQHFSEQHYNFEQSGNKAQRELTSAGHQAAYDTLTSDAGRGAAKAGLAAWASDDSNA